MERTVAAQVEEAQRALRDATEGIDERISRVEALAEDGRAQAAMALRANASEVAALRTAIASGREKALADATDAALAARAEWRERIAQVQQGAAEGLGKLEYDYREAQRRVDIRLAACWEGVREARLELGDVMQTVHLMVEVRA